MIKLNKIFKVEYGNKKYESKGNLIHTKNGIPLISSKGTDNGVHGFYDIYPDYEYILTIARTGTVGATFFHKYKCSADNNVLVLTPICELTENEMFFYAYLIGQESYKYLYGRQVTPTRLGNTLIPELSYVKNKLNGIVIDKSVDSSNVLNETNCDSKYDLFLIEDIFDVQGTKTTPPEVVVTLNKGIFPYITTKSVNNGVDGYYNIYTELGNCLTIDSATVGSIFYQEQNFIASDHVEKLTPKKFMDGTSAFSLNKYIGLYLVSILKQEMYRYNYGRKFNQNRIRNTKIKLPCVNINGRNMPDWKYMENYIKTLEYSNSI